MASWAKVPIVAELRVVFSLVSIITSPTVLNVSSSRITKASAGEYNKLIIASKLVPVYLSDSIITIRDFSSASLLGVVGAEIAFNDKQQLGFFRTAS